MSTTAYKFGKHTFHLLFPDLIRPLTPDERKRLKASIKERGKVTVPVVVDGAYGVIDGGNRLDIAAELKLSDVPFVIAPCKTLEEKEELCKSLNTDRRHLSLDEQKAVREKRVERVVEARAEGKSLRAIAEDEGVTPTQVARDLKDASGVTGVTPEMPAKVTGKDGKKYISGVTGVTPEMPKKTARNDNGHEKSKTTTVENDDGSGYALDALKRPVPDALKPVFCAVVKFKEAESHITNALQIVEALADEAAGSYLRVQQIKVDARNLKEAIRFSRPYTVCPYCKARKKDCEACKGRGFVHKLIYEQAPEDTKS